jgi:hypothetical protein
MRLPEDRNEFRKLVDAEAHTENHPAAAALREPRTAPRWREALVELKTEIETELASYAAQLKVKKQESLLAGPAARVAEPEEGSHRGAHPRGEGDPQGQHVRWRPGGSAPPGQAAGRTRRGGDRGLRELRPG